MAAMTSAEFDECNKKRCAKWLEQPGNTERAEQAFAAMKTMLDASDDPRVAQAIVTSLRGW